MINKIESESVNMKRLSLKRVLKEQKEHKTMKLKSLIKENDAELDAIIDKANAEFEKSITFL